MKAFCIAWCLILIALSGCGSCGGEDRPLPDLTVPDAGSQDARGDTFVRLSSAWTVSVSPQAPEAVRWAADDVARYLEQMGLEATVEATTQSSACTAGRGHVVFIGDDLGASSTALATKQTYGIDETRCGDGGALVELRGGGLLGRQYAAYAWLHELGVRFFHPEQEFVPAAPTWSVEPLQIEKTPAFEHRSVSLHLQHPLELGDPIELGVEPYMDEVKRYVDWQIKNFASYGVVGPREGELSDYGVRRGMPRSTGFRLYNQQQGGGAIIDPDSPKPPKEQIAEAIDRLMGDDPQNYPEQFHFTFNPSEFTEVDDEVIVDQLTFIADYFTEKYPDTILLTINHGSAGEPTENYGVRYYDLPKFAPPNLGVKVHTLMFYDLERPAPVYGNENFHFLYDFMVDQYQTRRLWYYPEAAWWLTFDIAVPLYLPITIEARDADIQKIAFMLAGKLDGHRAFGSGHEWGYWQNEYCSLRMATDLTYRWTDCLADITSPMGAAAEEVHTVVQEVVALQERDFIYDIDTLRYMVGSDEETELAAQIGIHFHPLPPLPEQMMRWRAQEAEHFVDTIEPKLKRMHQDYFELVERLRAVEDSVPEEGRPWFQEIFDGIEITGLRARHQYEAYGAVARMRLYQLGQGDSLRDEAEAMLDAAEKTTVEASKITARRYEGYRYRPRSRAIGGGRDGTEDSNWTGYPYRYLNRAHHLFYWRRTDRLAREAIEGTRDPFEVEASVLGPDEALSLSIVEPSLEDVSVALGDGTSSTAREIVHSYAAPGVYPVAIAGTLAGTPVEYEFEVAALREKYFTGRSGKLIEPETDLAEQIEAVMPALVFGPVDDDSFVLGTTALETPTVALGDFSTLSQQSETGFVYETVPTSLDVPLAVGASESRALRVENAIFRMETANGPVQLVGDLSTAAVIDAVVTLSGGAFDETTARQLVADALGYSPETLPETVPFVVEYQLL